MAVRFNEGDGVLSVAELNRHGEAADIVLGRALTDAGVPRRIEADTNMVTVKNNSGAERRRGDILEFTGLAFTTLTMDKPPWLIGGSPTLANGFGVLLNPIPDGKFGNEDCQVSGVCTAFVNVTDTNHKFAEATSGNYVLQSAESGPVRILWKPSGTGEKTCAVRLGDEAGTSTSNPLLTGVLTSELLPGASATVDQIAKNSTDDIEYTGSSHTVWDLLMNSDQSIPAGTRIHYILEEYDGESYYKLVSANCEVQDTTPAGP